MKIYHLILSAIICITISCEVQPAKVNPLSVGITSPLSNQVIQDDSTLIVYSIIGNDFNFDYSIVNILTGDTLYKASGSSSNDLNFYQKFAMPIVSGKFRLTVNATDNNGIRSSKSVDFKTYGPVITITDPADGVNLIQSSSEDSSAINADIVAEDMHSYWILITRLDGSDTLLYVPPVHMEVNNLHISYKFPLHVMSGTAQYKATVMANDHTAHEGIDTNYFSVTH